MQRAASHFLNNCVKGSFFGPGEVNQFVKEQIIFLHPGEETSKEIKETTNTESITGQQLLETGRIMRTPLLGEGERRVEENKSRLSKKICTQCERSEGSEQP